MKLFTQLAATAALLFCGATAQAQTVASTATDPENVTDGYYVLKTHTKGNDGYLTYADGSGYGSRFRHVTQTDAPTTADYIWYVTKTDNGLVIYNCGKGVYIPATSGHGGNCSINPTIDNAAVLTVQKNTTTGDGILENGCLMYQNNYNPYSSPMYLHCNDYSSTEYALSYWEGGTATQSGSCVQWEFYAVSDYTLEGLTPAYAVKMETTSGETTTTSYCAVTGGTSIETKAPSVNFTEEVSLYYTLPKATCAETDLTVSQSNATFHFTVSDSSAEPTLDESKVPFTFYDEADPVWYNVYFRQNTAGNLIKLTSENGIGTTYGLARLNGSYEAFKGGLWAFVKDGYGVKVLCKQTGTYITVASGTNGVSATLSADGTKFIVMPNSTNASGFSLKYPGETYAYLGDHASNHAGIWNYSAAQNDGGSCWMLNKVDDSDIIRNNGRVAMLSTINGIEIPTEGNLSCISQNAVDNAKTAAQVATTVEELEAAYDIVYNSNPVPETTAYYRIKSVNGITKAYATTAAIPTSKTGSFEEAYKADNSINRTVARVADGKTDGASALVPQLWKFEEIDGYSWNVANPNVGAYLCDYTDTNSSVDMPVDAQYAGAYTLKKMATAQFTGHDTQTQFQLVCNDHTINAFGGDAGDNLQAYDGNDGDMGNYWEFEKVTEVPVVISAVGYASVAFPFAVEVPTDEDVTVYYAIQAGDGLLKLEELTSGEIPANTGVLLAHDGATTVNCTILESADELTATNLLQAATAKRTGFTSGENYFLGKNSKEQAAFMKGTIETVPCNKAYLPATSINDTNDGASAAGLSFSLGGDTTGINAVQSESQRSVKYYDLSGRRVLFPSNGIFVTDKGEKVLVK